MADLLAEKKVFLTKGSWYNQTQVQSLITNGKFTADVEGVDFLYIPVLGEDGITSHFKGGEEKRLKKYDPNVDEIVTDSIVIADFDEIEIKIVTPLLSEEMLYTILEKDPQNTVANTTYKSGKENNLGVERHGFGLYVYDQKFGVYKDGTKILPVGVTGTGADRTFVTSTSGLPTKLEAKFYPCVVFKRDFEEIGKSKEGIKIIELTAYAKPYPGTAQIWFDGALYKA